MKRIISVSFVLMMILAFAGLVAITGCHSKHHGSSSDDDQADDDAADDDSGPTEKVEVFQQGHEVVIRNVHVSIRYNLISGLFDALDDAGNFVLYRAQSQLQSHVLIPASIWRSGDSECESSWTSGAASNALGQGMSLVVTRLNGSGRPAIEQTFTLLDGQGFVLSSAKAINFTTEPVKIGAIYPVVTDPSVGVLNFGRTKDIRVLTNGAFNYADFAVPMFDGNTGVVSNWSALVYNQATEKSLLIGWLTFEHSQPVVYYAPAPHNNGAEIIQAASQYDRAKILDPGAILESETMIMDFGQPTPRQALDTYGDRVKTWLGIHTWNERHPEIGTPAGWNSWSGSSSSGGYGQDINEQIVVDNMDFADRELRKWGMNFFQIDDGWQDHKGDWNVRPDRFPDHGSQNGIEWIMSRAKGLGFRTGLWVEVFQADKNSAIYAEHPDWFGAPFLHLFPEQEPPFDLSNPEVQAHIVDLSNKLQGWGIQWLKLDFAYRAMLSEDWYDPTLTRFEFYRNGVKLLRDSLAEDVFLANVALAGPNYGLIDASRLTLDTMPAWEGESDDPWGPIGWISNQGLKPMYRDVARRYWMSGRIWINHPDLIFFRSHTDPKIPPLSLNESMTFACAVALESGLVKLGDRLVDLKPASVDAIRRILPPVPRQGEPLDLMRREFPEVWSVPAEDFVEPYRVIGLLNWGLNRDLTTLPYSWIDDESRVIEADLAEAGLDPDTKYLAFEFWEQKFLGEVKGALSVEVPGRTPRIVALRQELGRPQLLGTNRHVLGGVGVIRSLDSSLTGVQEGAIGTDLAPFTNQVTLYAPEGFTASDAKVTAPQGYGIENQDLSTDGNIVALTFDVIELPDACAPGDICMHPDVTWEVDFQ